MARPISASWSEHRSRGDGAQRARRQAARSAAAARLAEAAGADGITAHLREDRRHIVDGDIEGLMRELKVPLNFEMAATRRWSTSRAPPPPCCLHRARKARGADDRGWARCGWPAQSPEADGRPPARRRHPRLAVHRGRSAPARGRGDAGRAGRRAAHRPLLRTRRRGPARRARAAAKGGRALRQARPRMPRGPWAELCRCRPGGGDPRGA